MRYTLSSILFFLLVASLALACEAVTHANDYSTGAAQVDTCADGTLLCNGSCVPEDSKNCGKCDLSCESTQVCSAGVCGSSCTGGTTQCGNLCVDTQNDPANCGRCGGFPDAGTCPICQDGACTNSCQLPSRLCKGKCLQFDNDPKNCGSCAHQCDPGQVCSGGVCGLSCGSLTECNGSCVDTSSNSDFCGPVGCGKPCTTAGGHGIPVCVNSGCTVACEQGFTHCDVGLPPVPECFCGACPILGSGAGGGTTCGPEQICNNGQCVGNSGH